MRPIILLAASLFIFSCSSSSNDSVDIPSLKAEVIAIHDEVMPKMGELRKVSKELRLAAEADSTKADWVETADQIAAANESMMVWMRGFEPNYEGTDEEIVNYLQDQKVKVEKVRDDMNGSLAAGKALLDQ
jgi:hypothetical protein